MKSETLENHKQQVVKGIIECNTPSELISCLELAKSVLIDKLIRESEL